MKTRKLTAILAAFALMLNLLAVIGLVPVSAAAASDDAVIADDFSGNTSVFGDNAAIIKGEAVITKENSMFSVPFPEDKLLASNNYVISFDMRYETDSHFYMHLVGLNGNDNSNIYFHCEANGMFLSLNDYYGHSIYNNSGDDTGGLNYNQVDLTQMAHFDIVHYNGYLEVWANGVRRCVSHLSNFGNNRYSTREQITEGTITGLGFHAEKANAVVIDDLVVKEAVAAETSYTATAEQTGAGNSQFLPLSARDLDNENFRVTGTYVLTDETAAGHYPTITLYGLNASLHQNNARSYGINFQSAVNGLEVLPQIFAQTDDIEWVSGGEAQALTLISGQTLTYRIDVFGDHIQFYINDVLKLDTTFTDMGITKGHLQYIRIAGTAASYWKNVSYVGLNAETGAVIRSEVSDEIMAGTTVQIDASAFGTQTTETFAWYVNGEKQAENGQTLTLENVESGRYEIVYRSESYTSNTIAFEAVSKKIVLSADALEMYPDGSVTISAELIGDFSDGQAAWYVNDKKYTEGAEALTLSSLAVGEYTVTLRCGDTVSNALTVTVRAASLQIGTSKYVYTVDEKAELTATAVGASGGSIAWFINGVQVEGENSETLSIDMSAYTGGEKLVVTAKCGDMESEQAVLWVSSDLLDQITSDEKYESISKMEIASDGTYGNYTVGTDDGNYLYITEAGGSWCDYTGAMPGQTGFVWEYKIYIPADIAGKYYVYPCFAALDSNYGTAMMETAVEVSPDGIRPYFKNQGSGSEYKHDYYGLGVDTSYAGVSKLGDWNTISLAVKGTHAAMYINGEQVLYVTIATMGVPTSISVNMWPDAGDTIPLKLKDFSVSGLVSPAPDLESVSVSASKVEAKVGEQIKFSASLNPFNAKAEKIEWFVNGSKADGSDLSFTFTAEEAGTYEIHCVIDGITSASKTVTVTADAEAPTQEPAENHTGVIVAIVAAVVVIGGVVVFIVLKKKK